MDWNYEIAKQHIENKLDEINDLEIIDYTRDVDIEVTKQKIDEIKNEKIKD